jgi:hypothetical protein
MIIQRYHYESLFKNEEAAHRSGNPSPFLVSHVKQLIERDILRQAELMLLDVPDDLEVSKVTLTDLKSREWVEPPSEPWCRRTRNGGGKNG